jgi:hypothetical protein
MRPLCVISFQDGFQPFPWEGVVAYLPMDPTKIDGDIR